jgi:hypothetical protein
MTKAVSLRRSVYIVCALMLSGSIQALTCSDVEQINGSLNGNGSGWISTLTEKMSSHPWETQQVGPQGQVYLSNGQGEAYCLEFLTEMGLDRCPNETVENGETLAAHCSNQTFWQYDPECKKCTFSYKWMGVDREVYFNFAKAYYGREKINKDLTEQLCGADSCW